MGSVGGKSKTEKRLAELQKELDNTKGFLAKAKIKSEMRMVEAGFTGTLDEWRAKEREERQKEEEQRMQAYRERQEAERKAKEEAEKAKQRQLEYELKTQPADKVEQFKITQKYNPMQDDYHVGIRKPSDIRTWAEAVKAASDDDAFAWGDFSKKDAEKALKSGKITIYSSYPIKQGVFVSTSRVQSEQYAGGAGKKVYSMTVPIEDVAWINGDEGQFAKIEKKKGKK